MRSPRPSDGTGASVEEIERVRLSKIDLDPENADNYIDVARAMADLGRHDRAFEYCKRASALEPNSVEPYRQALAMRNKAGNEGNETAMWAAENLLQREWGNDAPVYHQLAKSALEQIAGNLDSQMAARPMAIRVRLIYKQNRERDLVIELVWADQADLDLIVTNRSAPFARCRRRELRRAACGPAIDSAARRKTTSRPRRYNGSYEVQGSPRVGPTDGQQGDDQSHQAPRHAERSD